jgi:hypothetical protein
LFCSVFNPCFTCRYSTGCKHSLPIVEGFQRALALWHRGDTRLEGLWRLSLLLTVRRVVTNKLPLLFPYTVMYTGIKINKMWNV